MRLTKRFRQKQMERVIRLFPKYFNDAMKRQWFGVFKPGLLYD